MHITETLAQGLKRAYEITIPGADLTARIDTKLSEARPEIQMKGFRKGKIPMAVLKKQFGPRVMGDVIEEAIESAVKGHLDETGDRPAAQPDVKMTNKDWKEGDDVVVTMAYEKLPPIPEVDYKALNIERLSVIPAESDVQDALNDLAKNAQNFALKEDGVAADGDQIIIDFIGKIDDEPFEGGTAEDFALILGSGSFIPGFEAQLIGVAAGTQKDVNVTFPDDYGAKELAGKDAVFSCNVKEVRQPVPAAIDDELAKKFGADDLNALTEQITERLKTEYASAARQVTKRMLLDQLDDQMVFDVPPSLVAAEATQIAQRLWQDENPDEPHHHDQGTIEPTEEHNKLAQRRVKLGLLLAELGNGNDVQITDAEMTQAIMAQARQYPGQERAFIEFVQKNQNAQQQIRAPLFEDKVVDFILEMTDVTEKQVTKDELKAAIDALDTDDMG